MKTSCKLTLGDGIKFMESLESDSVDLVLTDPPYEEKYQSLFGDMAREASRVLKSGGSLVTLCGHYQVIDVGKDIGEHLRFWWIAGMLHDSLKRLPGKWVCITGKPALWFVKDRRRKGDTNCPIDYLKGSMKDKRFHKWGQPVNWFKHWIEMLTDPGDLVLDPFAGGGTTAVAALLSDRSFVGAEIDPATHSVAKERLLSLREPARGPA